jgi:hypothetical protein
MLKTTPNGSTNTTSKKCEFLPEFRTSTLLLTSKCLGPATISLYIDRRRRGSAVFGCERN